MPLFKKKKATVKKETMTTEVTEPEKVQESEWTKEPPKEPEVEGEVEETKTVEVETPKPETKEEGVVETKEEEDVELNTKNINLKPVVTRHGFFNEKEEEIPPEIVMYTIAAELNELKKDVNQLQDMMLKYLDTLKKVGGGK